MSKNLVLQGQLVGPLILFNRSIKRATDLSNSLPPGKSIIASSVAEAVSKSDIIFTCLSNDAAIEETIKMALKGNVKGKLFVDCSTVSPDTTERLEKNIIAAGAEFGTQLLSPITYVTNSKISASGLSSFWCSCHG